MKVDMHTHSIYSSDGTMPLKYMLKYAKKVGLGAIAITDHNEIEGALKAKKLGILEVIRGIEVSSAHGHVLAYGIDCKIPRDLSIEETIEKIHECGGIAVAAHPYRFWSGMGEKNAKTHNFDGIEAFNARCKESSNRKARKLANMLHKPFTAGSDAHFADSLGKAGIIVEAEKEEDILEEILKKNVEIYGNSRDMKETIRYVRRAISKWAGRGFKRI